MSTIGLDFDEYVRQINEKLQAATKLLAEANDLTDAHYDLNLASAASYDLVKELQDELVRGQLTLPENNGWSKSGCSF